MATKKTTRKARSSAPFEGTVLEQPMAAANKAFLAYIGLADQVKSGVEARIDIVEAKFNELAADGEKIRSRARKSADKARKDAVSNAKNTRRKVETRIESTIESILAKSPVATSTDVDKLNKKLDKVLAEVGK